MRGLGSWKGTDWETQQLGQELPYRAPRADHTLGSSEVLSVPRTNHTFHHFQREVKLTERK